MGEIINSDVTGALAASIASVHGAGIITGWIAVIEWCNTDGEFSAITLNDATSPPWRLEGLLGAVTDFYAEEEEEDE